MGHVGWGEILVVGAVALLVFGPARLPELGRSVGKAFRDFKDALSGVEKPPPPQIPQAPRRRRRVAQKKDGRVDL